MKKAATRSGNAKANPPEHGTGSYRGVKLLTPAVPPKTPLRELQKAVDAAVAKHAHAFAKEK
jgi:hypothetical protein